MRCLLAGVTDVAVVERGRNVVSVSRDGSARLWDCGRSEGVAKFVTTDCSVINGCSLGVPAADFSLPGPDDPPGFDLVYVGAWLTGVILSSSRGTDA